MNHIDEGHWAEVMAAEDTELDPPASGEAIASFEAMHGVALPAAHREFLLRANGGIVGYARLFDVGRPNGVATIRVELPVQHVARHGPVDPPGQARRQTPDCVDKKM